MKTPSPLHNLASIVLSLVIALCATSAFIPTQAQYNPNMPDVTQFQMMDIANQAQTTVDEDSLTFKTRVLRKRGVVLVELMLPTCAQCSPVVRAVKDIVARYDGKIGYLRLDINKNLGLGDRYDVLRVPAILVFKDGQLVEKFVVFNIKQKDILVATINRALGIPPSSVPSLAAKDSAAVK